MTLHRALGLARLTMSRRASTDLVGALALGVALGACGPGVPPEVRVDGSSTVFPITEAVAEEFLAVEPGIRVTVGISGTGGGFEKFAARETDLNNASRPIQESEEAQLAADSIPYVELPLAYDGISVVVHPSNDFVVSLTVEELRRLWRQDSDVDSWRDLRSEWPAREIHLFGPGPDSGTFDSFTEAVNGRTGRARGDYLATEDDNVIVQGVAGEPDGLGFLGFAFVQANRDRLKLVAVDNGPGPLQPNAETIFDGTYAPLTRLVYVYVARPALRRPEVARFVEFYLERSQELAAEVGFVPLSAADRDLAGARLREELARIAESTSGEPVGAVADS